MTRLTPLQCTLPAASGEPVISLSNVHSVIITKASWQTGCCCDCVSVLLLGLLSVQQWECILMLHFLWLLTERGVFPEGQCLSRKRFHNVLAWQHLVSATMLLSGLAFFDCWHSYRSVLRMIHDDCTDTQYTEW